MAGVFGSWGTGSVGAELEREPHPHLPPWAHAGPREASFPVAALNKGNLGLVA